MKKRTIYQMLSLLLILSLLCACGSDASATSMRLKKVIGTVGVNDGADKAVEVREDLGLYSGYGVSTETESYAWVDLDTAKLAKLDQESSVSIGKDGRKLTVNVESGSLFFYVTEPLKDDESMEIRTSSMAIGIRGTCGWVELSEDGKAAGVFLLEGKVECSANGKSASIAAGEGVAYAEGGEITVGKFTAADIPSFVLEEAEEDERLMKMIRDMPGQNGPGASSEDPGFVPWDEAGLKDHVMDWKDEPLKNAMVRITGIRQREIMLSDVWEIQNLELDKMGIGDISALGELTNLTRLVVTASSRLSDISALKGLTNLTYLDLNHNGSISDISALAGLTNLTHLDLGGTATDDIGALKGLTNLAYLDLKSIYYVNGFTPLDHSVLSGLTNLTHLELFANGISDLGFLSGLTNLTYLNLGGNEISDVSALGGLRNLTHLELSNNHSTIDDFSPVEFVPELW